MIIISMYAHQLVPMQLYSTTWVLFKDLAEPVARAAAVVIVAQQAAVLVAQVDGAAIQAKVVVEYREQVDSVALVALVGSAALVVKA
jgi:hypothetical protein